jgi:transcriptional regulator GlxA family with amidase domain
MPVHRKSFRVAPLAALGATAVAAAALLAATAPPAAAPEAAAGPKRNVAVVVYDGMEILDFAGPSEVFKANSDAFNVYTVGESAKPILSQGFITITPQYTVADSPRPDVVVVPGGNSGTVRRSEALMKWIKSAAGGADTVMSVCTGAFVLADAGLLDGLEATTWYGAVDNLRKVATKTTVRDHVRFVDNGKVITTAGVSAGIDGALHVVAKLLGPDAATATAAYMEYDKWHPEDGRVVEGAAQKEWRQAESERAAKEAAAAVPARREDGVQVARVVVDDDGYQPAVLRLQAGVPARLVFLRRTDSECAAKVQIPELGVGVTELPKGKETVIEVTPAKAGRYRFTCGLNMLNGTLLVSEDAATAR